MILAMTPSELSIDWVDKGLDGLREEIDGDFARRDEELGELRREVEHLTRRRPSFFARWGLAPLPKPSRRSWHTSTSSSSPSMPPTGLSWTDGRMAELQSHVRNASTRASDEVAEIKAQIAEFNEEISERRLNRQTFLWVSACAAAGLALGSLPKVVALLA